MGKNQTWAEWLKEHKEMDKTPVYHQSCNLKGFGLIDGVYATRKIKLENKKGRNLEKNLATLYTRLKEEIIQQTRILGGNCVFSFKITKELELASEEKFTSLNLPDPPPDLDNPLWKTEEEMRDHYLKTDRKKLADEAIAWNDYGRDNIRYQEQQSKQQKTLVYRASGDAFRYWDSQAETYWLPREKIRALRKSQNMSQAKLTEEVNALKLRDKDDELFIVVQSKISDIETRGSPIPEILKEALCKIFKLKTGELD